jgi:hypothetical protein
MRSIKYTYIVNSLLFYRSYFYKVVRLYYSPKVILISFYLYRIYFLNFKLVFKRTLLDI